MVHKCFFKPIPSDYSLIVYMAILFVNISSSTYNLSIPEFAYGVFYVSPVSGWYIHSRIDLALVPLINLTNWFKFSFSKKIRPILGIIFRNYSVWNIEFIWFLCYCMLSECSDYVTNVGFFIKLLFRFHHELVFWQSIANCRHLLYLLDNCFMIRIIQLIYPTSIVL